MGINVRINYALNTRRPMYKLYELSMLMLLVSAGIAFTQWPVVEMGFRP